MSTINNIKVYRTSEHPCSYLDKQDAVTMFVDPDVEITEELYAQLNELGFRRSGKHLYSPHCQNCQACIATRVPVNEFTLTRRQQRTLKRNHDLITIPVDSIDSADHYQLYARYIEARHADGDMYPPTPDQYQEFIGDKTAFSRYFEIRDENQLFAVAVLDRLPNGYSSIYTFFDPDESHRSLGNYAILQSIELTRRKGLDHLYLGYWVRECEKMAYKIDFQPIELLLNGRWQRLF